MTNQQTPQIRLSEPLFSFTHCPLNWKTTNVRSNWNNRRYWLFFLSCRWHCLKNLFVVNRHYLVQSDGVRRYYSHIGLTWRTRK